MANDMQFLTWKDPYAWAENVEKFRRAAADENRIFETAVRGAAKSDEIKSLQTAFKKAALEQTETLVWTYRCVDYRPNLEGGGGYLWAFTSESGAHKWKTAGDIDALDEKTVVYSEERGKGTQSYRILARTRAATLWEAEPETAAEFAILGDTLYALEVDTPLRYNRLITLDVRTGKGRRVLYENKDDRWTLRLVKGGNHGLFLIREQAGYQQGFFIQADGSLEPLSPKAVCIVPVGASDSGAPLYLARKRAFSAPWVGIGISMPREIAHDGIEFAGLRGIFVSRNFGERRLWSNGKLLRSWYGNVLVNPLEIWHGTSEPACIWSLSPGSTIQKLSVSTGNWLDKGHTYAKVRVGIAIGANALPVRWVLAYQSKKPRGLLIYVYGGYGAPTPLGTARWKPWLDAGWAVGFALVRGGGDGNEVWASMGRLGGKEAGIDDLEGVIVTLQELTGCSQGQTVLFGRSAGGLMLGGIAGRHPDGGLVRKIYAEVPYVDLLKTAANPSLPLTPSEYEEFGNPRAGPAEFQQALASSPVHRLPDGGAPGITVVCRTGFFDLQVYPYESLKWILALRGGRDSPDAKFLHVETEGHFTHGSTRYKNMAEDFLLLQQ